jgi:hypothetical protein
MTGVATWSREALDRTRIHRRDTWFSRVAAWCWLPDSTCGAGNSRLRRYRIEDVRRGNRDTGVAHFSTSDTRRLIYVPGPFIGPEYGEQQIVLADRSGVVERVALPPGAYRGVRASPTGRHITFASDSGRRGIVIPVTCPAR